VTIRTLSSSLLSRTLLYTGIKPLIHAGGSPQDFAVSNKSLNTAIGGIVDPAKSPDYRTTITVGPAYFESYLTWPDTKFIHEFNLGKNDSIARQGLLDSVRTSTWNEQDYVTEWLIWTKRVRMAMERLGPELAARRRHKYYVSSFAGTGSNGMDPILVWEARLNADKDIALISSHDYIGGAKVPGVTLQGILMNHSNTVQSITKQLNSSRYLAALSGDLQPNLPFILGERNSLYNQGQLGPFNTFSAALWGVDSNICCIANEIKRVHAHGGTNYHYRSWHPVDTIIISKGTKAPCYGNVAVAAFLSDLCSGDRLPQVVNLPLPNEIEAAYVSCVGGK
jgi:hypothetical protein